MGGTDTVFAPNLSRAGPSDLSGSSGGDDLLLQGAPTRYRLDLSSLILNPVIKYRVTLEIQNNGMYGNMPSEDFDVAPINSFFRASSVNFLINPTNYCVGIATRSCSDFNMETSATCTTHSGCTWHAGCLKNTERLHLNWSCNSQYTEHKKDSQFYVLHVR